MPPAAHRARLLMRATLGLFLAIHGAYRIYDGGVNGFGGFLGSEHVPLGVAVAWLITIVEVVGGSALIFGFFVTPLCAWFALELFVGIVLVHAQDGWFVVGGGRNGMEYSVLLIVALITTGLLHLAAEETKGPTA